MKKMIIGALSFGIIASGGVAGVNAKGSQMEMERMHQMMSESNAVINFGHAKNIMEQIHPEMTIQEIREMYTNMHGTNGAAPSKNFKEMEHNH